MDCKFKLRDDNGATAVFVCTRCYRPTPEIPNHGQRIVRACAPGWGDYAAAWLTYFTGITKADVERWFGAECGCTQRQEKLNTLGDRVAAAWSWLRGTPKPRG